MTSWKWRDAVTIPTFAGVSHISFSARDAEASAAWWRDVMGFEEYARVSGDDWFGIVLVHPPTSTLVEFQQHEANDGESFDPRRTGLDHMGLRVPDRSQLSVWEEHFHRSGVDHTPIVDAEYGSVLTFRDPDMRQYEMFYRINHP
jgi:glyoxylase I family protein